MIELKFKESIYNFYIESGVTVKMLKCMIFDVLKVRIEAQRLIYMGSPLLDESIAPREGQIVLVLQLT
jgi:hypothetical protein